MLAPRHPAPPFSLDHPPTYHVKAASLGPFIRGGEEPSLTIVGGKVKFVVGV